MGAFMTFKATDTVLHYSVHSGNELYEEIIQVQSACTEKESLTTMIISKRPARMTISLERIAEIVCH